MTTTLKFIKYSIILQIISFNSVFCKLKKVLPQKGRRKDNKAGFYLILCILAIVFFTPMVMCVYNISMDPATPALYSDGMEYLKDRGFGFLSRKKKSQESKL